MIKLEKYISFKVDMNKLKQIIIQIISQGSKTTIVNYFYDDKYICKIDKYFRFFIFITISYKLIKLLLKVKNCKYYSVLKTKS